MNAENKAKELGLELGGSTPPIGNYVAAVTSGELVFVSGQLPVTSDGSVLSGQIGVELSIEDGYEAARLATIGLLARLRSEAGSLDSVKRIVKLTGYVNAAAGFTQHAQVVNGGSDLLAAVFGEAGLHARAAVGVASLPLGAPVELELIAEVN
jgi:enamine deaminase RidA (YjgF/YER057c/UK114 family)